MNIYRDCKGISQTCGTMSKVLKNSLTMGFTLLPKGSKGPWKAWINKLMLLWCTQITSIISLLIGGEGFTYMRPHMMCDQSYISPLH